MLSAPYGIHENDANEVGDTNWMVGQWLGRNSTHSPANFAVIGLVGTARIDKGIETHFAVAFVQCNLYPPKFERGKRTVMTLVNSLTSLSLQGDLCWSCAVG